MLSGNRKYKPTGWKWLRLPWEEKGLISPGGSLQTFSNLSLGSLQVWETTSVKALPGSTLASGLLFSKVLGTKGQVCRGGGEGACWRRKERLPILWNKPALLYNHSLIIFQKLTGFDSCPRNLESSSKGRYCN